MTAKSSITDHFPIGPYGMLRIDGFRRGAVIIQNTPSGVRVQITKEEGGAFACERLYPPNFEPLTTIYRCGRVGDMDGLRKMLG